MVLRMTSSQRMKFCKGSLNVPSLIPINGMVPVIYAAAGVDEWMEAGEGTDVGERPGVGE